MLISGERRRSRSRVQLWMLTIKRVLYQRSRHFEESVEFVKRSVSGNDI